jgi:predicted peroxiredoxin
VSEQPEHRADPSGPRPQHGMHPQHAQPILPSQRALVIKCTTGAENAERCSQAFTVAATAAATGVPTSLWLTGEAAWFGLPGKAEEFVLPHSAALAELRDTVLAQGTLTVCTQCAQRRGIEPAHLLPGARIAGSASYLAEILRPYAQALVY